MMRLPESSLLFKGLASEDTNVKKKKFILNWSYIAHDSGLLPLPSPVIQLWTFSEMMPDVDLVRVGLEREW